MSQSFTRRPPQSLVRKNSGGSDIGPRRRLNFIEGTNVTLTITDDGASDEIDITIAASGGGGSPLTTKGDLFGYDTADARLPVGADGTILQADSGEGLGVGWDTTLTGQYRLGNATQPITLGPAGAAETQLRWRRATDSWFLEVAAGDATGWDVIVEAYDESHATTAGDRVWYGGDNVEVLRWDESTTRFDLKADFGGPHIVDANRFAVNGDADTYIDQTSGADTLSIWVGGAEALRFTESAADGARFTGDYLFVGAQGTDAQFEIDPAATANTLAFNIYDSINSGVTWLRKRDSGHSTEARDLIVYANNAEVLRHDFSATQWTFTDEVALPSGSAATPSLTFSADPNLGLYRAAADELGFAGNGSERIRFDMATGGGGIRTDQSGVYAPLMETATVTDQTDIAAAASFTQWGTEEIDIAWPASTPCRVMAWGLGHIVYNTGGGKRDVRITISFDGGSTWDSPAEFDSGYIDSGDTWAGFSPIWHKQGTPTGNIQVRLEYRSPNSGVDLNGGRMFCLVLGDI